MSKWRDYSNDKIYRIIGQVRCEPREGGHYVCKSRSALQKGAE